MRRVIPAVAHFPPRDTPITGWFAVSETYLANPNPQFAAFRWVRTLTPVARVGKSITLFYVAPPTGAQTGAGTARSAEVNAARSRASP
jgi:hypothetical protein